MTPETVFILLARAWHDQNAPWQTTNHFGFGRRRLADGELVNVVNGVTQGLLGDIIAIAFIGDFFCEKDGQ